jgi:hypothetical protein
MGTEPKEEDMPIDLGDFPPYIQYIFNVYNMLPDKWEGMSGTYMGKDYGILPFLLDMEGIEERDERKDAFQFIALIDRAARKYYNEKQSQERKQKEASRHKGRSIKG